MNVNISVHQEKYTGPPELDDHYEQLIDIFVFEHSDDYICYVQKVHLMKYENMTSEDDLKCDFTGDDRDFFKQ